MSEAQAAEILRNALGRWQAASPAAAQAQADTLVREFPDDHETDVYWTSASDQKFRDFFTWGHDHDFGHGVVRKGAMGRRHLEIIAEGLMFGLLPANWNGLRVLDVGCWSGGDALALAGFGAKVQALEEHPRSAASARKLFELTGADIPVHVASVYADRMEWRGAFDAVYASGVIYHVTDPLLFLRILFAYLKPGGRIFLETKGQTGDGSVCGYSGTLERGWNWYAPTREAFGRWLVDAGFGAETVQLKVRGNGRLLAAAVKTAPCKLSETAGFSRPGSWLEGEV